MCQSVHQPGIDLAPHTHYRHYPVHLERLNWLYKTIQAHRPQPHRTVHILDVGCGTGNITVPLGLLPNSQILGIDLHQGNVDAARAINPHPHVQLELRYLHDCDLSHFDFVIFTEVLEHIPNYRDLLAHLARHARPDTHLLVTIPNGYGPFEWAMTPMYVLRRWGLNSLIKRVKRWVGKKEPYALNQEEAPHVNFFTQAQLAADERAYGFKRLALLPAFVLTPIVETYLPFVPNNRWLASTTDLPNGYLCAGQAAGTYTGKYQPARDVTNWSLFVSVCTETFEHCPPR